MSMESSRAMKLFRLLDAKQRRAAAGLLGLMLVGMVLETLGIGLVVPVLALMTRGDLAIRYPLLAPLLGRLGHPSHENMVLGGMLSLVGIYGIKVLFLAFLAWRQACFAFGLRADLSQRLYGRYLQLPYAFHLRRNSAQLIHGTIGLAGDVADVIQRVLMLGAELLVMLGISALLLTIQPIGAVLVGSALGLAAWAFYRLTRGRILLWGKARQLHEGLRIQHLQQGLGGVKEVKLLGRENEFLEQYWAHNIASAHVAERETTLQALPRLWLELLAVTGLSTLVTVMLGQGKPLESLLPMLGLFAAAAFRILPAVTRSLACVQSMRFHSPAIDGLHAELSLAAAGSDIQRDGPLPFRDRLVLDQAVFRYESAETTALSGVSLNIPQGATVGFIGTTGAGKSTLVDVILGLLPPDRGSVTVDGVDIRTRLRDWQDQIGYVPQTIFLTDDTLRRNVAFGLSDGRIDEAAVRRAIKAAQLEDFIAELPQGLETVVGERGVRLSGGQRQRIGIARALYHDPQVLVLDEATSSLDTVTERGVMEAVRALKGEKTLLIVAHRLSTVENCDILFHIEKGRIKEAQVS